MIAMQMRKTNPAGQNSKSINRRTALIGALAGGASLLLSSSAKAQPRPWPSRPVRIVTSGPPGSSPDLAARIWSEKLSPWWKQPIVIENKPGGDGIIAVQAMLAARDGHTLFFGPHFVYSTLHNTNADIALRPRDEMAPICATSTDFIGIAVSTRLPVSSLPELRAYAQAHPGTLNWFAPSGSMLWLLFSDFVLKTDTQMLFVPYRGSPQAIIDLAEDRLHIAMMPLGPIISQAEAGKVRLIATMGSRRPPAVPSIATASEQGMPEMSVEGLFGLYAPKAMSTALLDTIDADVRSVAEDPDLAGRFERIGQGLRALSRAAFTAELAAYETRTADLAQKYKTKPN